MKYEDLDKMPEYPGPEIIEKFCLIALEDNQIAGIRITMERLNELGDKQWHTYASPSAALKKRLTSWLQENWKIISEKYLVEALGIGYCYALDKAFFKEMLDQYDKEDKKEFLDAYNNSNQGHIDPWWSLGVRKSK